MKKKVGNLGYRHHRAGFVARSLPAWSQNILDKIFTFYKQNALKYTHTRHTSTKNVCFKISLHFADRGSKARLFFVLVVLEEADLPRRASGARLF